MALSFLEAVKKFNQYHDKKGLFTTANGANSFTYAPGKSNAHDKAIAREKERNSGSAWQKSLDAEKEKLLQEKPVKQALHVYKTISGDDSEYFPQLEDMCVDAFQTGKSEALVNDYYKLMAANGDPTPPNGVSKQMSADIRNDVASKKYAGYESARKAYVKDVAGLSDAEAEASYKALTSYFGGQGQTAEMTAGIDKYIEKAPAYDGNIYRGMSFSNSDYESFMQNIEVGSKISMRGNSSWSSSKEMAAIIAHRGDNNANSVEIVCVKNRTSTPVDHLSHFGEDEVIAHSKTKWTVLHHETVEWPSGVKKTRIAVAEVGEQQ